MNKELAAAVKRGATLLDRLGPPDWRERLRNGDTTNPIGTIFGFSTKYAEALLQLGLVDHSDVLSLDPDETRARADYETLIHHGFWYYNPTTPDYHAWYSDEQKAAWQRVANTDNWTKLPED